MQVVIDTQKDVKKKGKPKSEVTKAREKAEGIKEIRQGVERTSLTEEHHSESTKENARG